MKIGYARVSTDDQNLDRQTDALIIAGVDLRNIYKEKITGTTKDRPELNKMIMELQTGDILIISDLTRLSRSTKDLISLSESINNKGVELVSLKEKIDTTTATGKAMFGMLAVMAQFERDLISERTKEGLASARARGRIGGRPKVMNNNKIKMAKTLYNDKNNSIKDICDTLNISKQTLYRYLDLKGKSIVNVE